MVNSRATSRVSASTLLAEEIAALVIDHIQANGPIVRRLFTLKDACEYTGLTEDSIRHKAAAGEIPVTRIDRHLRFDRMELDRWIRENTHIE